MTRRLDMQTLFEQQHRLQELITRAAQYLCIEGNGRHGSWGDTRTTCDAIWALCNCGIAQVQKPFIKYCLDRLVTSEEVHKEHGGICFNMEVWDTSLALIAIIKGDKDNFSQTISKLKKWLLSETTGRSWKTEPWETLWALSALLLLAKEDNNIHPLIKRSLSWVLSRRNSESVLISSHYMGFLLAVISEAEKCLSVTERDIKNFNSATDKCLSYLKNEYLKHRKRGALWDNEPWIVGHVLIGIASSMKSRELFFNDIEFNKFLLTWYEKKWKGKYGWGDLVETSFTLVGLADYYVEREAYLRNVAEISKTDIRKQLASNVLFRFEISKVAIDMTVRPRWKGRNFVVKTDDCFVLMPFKKPWSSDVYILLREIFEKKGFNVKRADEWTKQDVLENIWEGINEARIIVADITDMSTNVLYELGIAHTVGKDVILLSQNTQEIPFDLLHINVVSYANDEAGFAKLREVIPSWIDEILHG